MNSARDCARHSETKASFNGWGRKSSIIDYIFYRGFRKCKRFKVLDRPFAGVPYISDHYPIIADMVL